MKKIVTIALFWAIGCMIGVYAQNRCEIVIRGIIKDSIGLLPIPQAEIFSELGHRQAKSNDLGYFLLKVPCADSILLEVDAPNYTHRHYHFNLPQLKNGDTFLLLLNPKIISLKAVAIEGYTLNAVTTSQINGSEIAEDQSHQDLGNIMKKLPGFQTIGSGGNIHKPMAQGMYGWRLPIYVSGVRLSGQPWGMEHALEIGASLINQVLYEPYEGGPDAYVGMIHFKIKPLHSNPFYNSSFVTSSYASNGNQLQIGGGFEYTPHLRKDSQLNYSNKTSYNGTFHAKMGGDLRSPNYQLTNTGIREYSGKLHIDIKNKTQLQLLFFRNESGILRSSSIGNTADLLNAIKNVSPIITQNQGYQISQPRQVNTHVLVTYNQTLPKLKNNSTHQNHSLKMAAQWDRRSEFDFHRNSSLSFPQLDLYLGSIHLNYFRNIILNKKIIFFNAHSETYVQRFGGYYFLPHYLQQRTSVIIEQKWKKVTLKSALESQLFQAERIFNKIGASSFRSFLNPSISLLYSAHQKKSHINLFLGLFSRAPGINELYSNGVHKGGASFEMGNPDLRSESNLQMRLNFQNNPIKSRSGNANFTINTQFFAHYFPNFINLTPLPEPILTVRGALPAFTYKQFEAIYTGADVDLKYTKTYSNFHVWEFHTKGGFLYARDLTHQVFPAFVPPGYLGIQIIYSSKYFTFSAEYKRIFQQSFYTQESDYLPPPPAYSLINAKLTFKGFSRKKWSLTAGIDNLMNISYRDYLDRFRYFSDRPGRNIYFSFIYHFTHANQH